MFIKKFAIFLAFVYLSASFSFVSAQISNELKPIVVYGVGFDEPLESALPQTEIISSSQIHSSGLSNVGDILEKLGGVHMRQDLGVNMNASPDLRGYGATSQNNTVILIDGIKISQDEQSPARIWSIPVEAIDHIELIRGSASVLYGEGATSGAINIITNKKKLDFGVVSIGSGSFGTVTSDFYMSKSAGDSKLSFYGKSYNSDGYRQQSANGLNSAGFQWDHAFSDFTTLGIRYGIEKNKANLPGYLNLTKYSQNPALPQNDLNVLFNNQPVTADIRSDIFNFYIKHRVGDYEYIFDASRRNNKTDFMNTSWYENDQYDTQHDSLSARIKISHFLLSNNTAITGLSYTSSHRDQVNFDLYAFPSTQSFSGKSSQTGTAAFLQNDWKMTANDRITLGVRHEFFAQKSAAIGIDWNGAMSYGSLTTNQSGSSPMNAYELQYTSSNSSGNSKYIKFARSYRLPNVDDLTRSQNYDGGLLLKPQINMDSEIGLTYQSEHHRGHFKIYRSLVSDEILFDKTSDNWVGYNINAPKTRHQGVELTNLFAVSKILTILSSASINDAVFMTDTVGAMTGVMGKKISGSPGYMISIGADYRIFEHQAVSWKYRLIGNQHPQGDNQNLHTMGAYSVSDIGYRWTGKSWSFSANLNNAFDKKYGVGVLAKNDPATPNFPYVVYPNWGRNFQMTIRYSFL